MDPGGPRGDDGAEMSRLVPRTISWPVPSDVALERPDADADAVADAEAEASEVCVVRGRSCIVPFVKKFSRVSRVKPTNSRPYCLLLWA